MKRNISNVFGLYFRDVSKRTDVIDFKRRQGRPFEHLKGPVDVEVKEGKVVFLLRKFMDSMPRRNVDDALWTVFCESGGNELPIGNRSVDKSIAPLCERCV